MLRKISLYAVIVVSLWLLVMPASADVKLPSILGSSMVLQQGMKVPFWGWADAGEEVTVAIGDQKASCKANDAGEWKVALGPFKAGGAPVEVTIAGKNSIKLTDVLIGEVWVCSGQSNMAMNVQASMNSAEEIAEANYPQIRLFTVARTTSDKPLTDLKTPGQWAPCSPANVGTFSATAYFFGRHLHKTLNVPVGLIHTSWGGTPAEAWTALPVLQGDPFYKDLLDSWEARLAVAPAQLERYNTITLPKWRADAAQARKDGRPIPPQPRPPAGPDSPNRPANLYNAMIAPLVPVAIQGVIWYQGEANSGRAYQYRKLLPDMITNWRKVWGQGDFPFLIVQLANYKERQPEPGGSTWAELREAQAMTAKNLPKVGLACIIDIGMADNIHPVNKQDVGKRLGLVAQKIAYGQDIPYSGPMYDSMTVEGNAIRIKFTCTFGGLVAQGGQPLKGFAIAGEDKKFVWANAKIEGDSVLVSSEAVQKPVAVRYAWADNPECNLYNAAGLPACPFRTDDWPGITASATK